MRYILIILFIVLQTGIAGLKASNDITYSWYSQSNNSSESMPVGGGDIGLTVWVENNELLFYMQQSGAFDENNSFLKAGRFRLSFEGLEANPEFKQTLNLTKGLQSIKIGRININIWVDVFKPVVHIELQSKEVINSSFTYENWRMIDREFIKGETDQSSWKWTLPKDKSYKADHVEADTHSILFYHQNKDSTIFDLTVNQQGLDSKKNQLYNPLIHRISGGKIYSGDYIFSGSAISGDTKFKSWKFTVNKPSKNSSIQLVLLNQQSHLNEWQKKINSIHSSIDKEKDRKKNLIWWKEFDERSFIHMDEFGVNTNSTQELESFKSLASQISRNYTLFRHMLAANAYGEWPTRFNGGLFSFDPLWVDSTRNYSPDYRRWTGGTFTAQNQRLVYWPMLKSGDFDLMIPQFEFYLRILKTAELRSENYWGHRGGCFAEQIENFGLPNPTEYGWKRPINFDKGVEYNAWLEYSWETILEFSQMIIDAHNYSGMDIGRYIPLIESSYEFFFAHYNYAAQQRGRKNLDGENHLILYPASACETFKMATNPSSTIAALMKLSEGLKNIQNKYTVNLNIDSLSALIPPIPLREIAGKQMIAPAKNWERANNVETPQLYPVFPWRIYGIGRPELNTALDTYLHDPWTIKMRSHTGWKQDAIFAACIGLTEEAKSLTGKKLANGPYRFPAYWGPGFDWSPDHNWGGSGMIALQEMLLQEGPNGEIYLCPAWPSEWDVHFKLHCQGKTTVEAAIVNGKLNIIEVLPTNREKDIKFMLK